MAGSVGTAFLTLVPKLDKGFAKTAENAMAKTGDTGGKKFSGKFNGSLIQTFKGLAKIGAVAKAGKIVGDIFVGAFNKAADYEQLVGGVETMFKDSSDTLIAYAKDAYKTSGMSANQYMEQATSFSASLIQSLGGDTAKAADYANMAMVDMSDNANKMGTSMESITNAYQGFAKGNYTMLDNLKLGFGGTQQEAMRLVNTAAGMKDKMAELGVTVNANDLSFSNLVSAIHVVQADMGIMGTTSQEAANTVSGSIQMLKASWDNLLTAMGTGENVEEAANQIVDSFITALGNIIPLASQVIVGMGGALLTALGNLMVSGVNAVNSKYGEFEQAAVNLIKGMVAGLTPDAVINKIKEICAGAVDAIKNFFGIHSPSTVMRDLFGYVGEGMVLGIEDSEKMVGRSMDGLLDTAYGKAASFGVGLNARMSGNGRATNADVVGAINRLESNLYGIIKDATPDAMTPRQFGRAVRAYA